MVSFQPFSRVLILGQRLSKYWLSNLIQALCSGSKADLAVVVVVGGGVRPAGITPVIPGPKEGRGANPLPSQAYPPCPRGELPFPIGSSGLVPVALKLTSGDRVET